MWGCRTTIGEGRRGLRALRADRPDPPPARPHVRVSPKRPIHSLGREGGRGSGLENGAKKEEEEDTIGNRKKEKEKGI